MQVILTRIDIPRTQASWPDTEFTPAYVAARKPGDNNNWMIADTKISTDEANPAVNWAVAASDEYLRIPLFSYDLQPKADLALASMFRLGIMAASAHKGKIRVMHLVIGTPAELIYAMDGDPVSINYWFGFAFA